MKGTDCKKKLSKTLNKVVDHKKVFGAVVRMESGDGTFVWEQSAGNLEVDSKYAIASITKMYTTAVILALTSQGKIGLEDQIAKYVPKEMLEGLHLYKGVDYSFDITIRQLMTHTSGLADYYEEKQKNGKALATEMVNQDFTIELEEILRITRELDSHFKPGEKGKAFYSDTNFDLLGVVIEKVTGKSLDEVFTQYIYEPLGLVNTHFYHSETGEGFAPIYYKDKALHRPLMIGSAGASGGIVSNVQENIIFLKSFFGGKLFPKSYIQELSIWNRLQWFPLQYGGGMMRCKVSRMMSPIIPAPELVGHSGSTGTFAYYNPDKDMFIVGTVNQVTMRPFGLMYTLLHHTQKTTV